MSNARILVVDDDPTTRLLMQKRISKEIDAVDTAESGSQAIEKISASYYDIVLTDLIMPGDLNGIGVLEKTKELSSSTEVILITAYATVDTAVEAMKKGAADYLQKPINFDELFLRIEKIINMNKLFKDASDLRIAMDTTESNAASTIQGLELTAAALEKKLAAVNALLHEEWELPEQQLQKARSLLEEA
jgi:two-component system OmpR family response regulator